MAKDVIELRIVKGGTYPGLSEGALNAVMSTFVKERHREIRYTHRREGAVKTGRDRSEVVTSQGMWVAT